MQRDDMQHDDMRQLMALRAYGETNDLENERVDRHLATCAACTDFAHELEAGVGRLVALDRPHDSLEPGWDEALRRASGLAEPRRSFGVPWAAAAGFLLGAATIGILVWARGALSVEPQVANRVQAQSVEGEPPRSTAGPGPIGRFAGTAGTAGVAGHK